MAVAEEKKLYLQPDKEGHTSSFVWLYLRTPRGAVASE